MDIALYSACAGAGGATLLILVVILGLIASRGAGALGPGFLLTASRDFGAAGGILYQILGTIILMATAGVISLPVALGAALYRTEYLRVPFKRTADLFVYALGGVPTIIFGLFGYMVFGAWLGLGVSWLTGALILGVMVLPTMVVSIEEALNAIPPAYREEALALGLGEWAIMRRVLLPGSAPGVLTGLFLGLSRAAGETAAIMFTATAFSGVRLPHGLGEPVATLQTHILVLAGEAINPAARRNAWGAALVLVGLVMALGLAAMAARSRTKTEAGR